MIRLESIDTAKADAGVNSKQLVDLSREQTAKTADRQDTNVSAINPVGRVQFSNIYNDCCTGVDKSRGPQNRNERAEQQGAATDPKWGSARDRLTKGDSQKNEIREKGYREIQYGDTLSDIAKANLELKSGGKAASGAEIWREVERIAKLNNLDPRKNIRPGTKIYMEKCEDQNKPPKADIQENKPEPGAPKTRDGGKILESKGAPSSIQNKPSKSAPDEPRTSGDTKIEEDPPVNFTPDAPAPGENAHLQEQYRREEELRNREEALKNRDEDLSRRELELTRQLEDLKRQKDELRKREEVLKRCGPQSDNTGVWEH